MIIRTSEELKENGRSRTMSPLAENWATLELAEALPPVPPYIRSSLGFSQL